MNTPIELMLNEVDWTETKQVGDETGELYSTHEGLLEITGKKLRCYRLNNGQAVFHADDFKAFFEGLI